VKYLLPQFWVLLKMSLAAGGHYPRHTGLVFVPSNQKAENSSNYFNCLFIFKHLNQLY
jgi:hypothetical protein